MRIEGAAGKRFLAAFLETLGGDSTRLAWFVVQADESSGAVELGARHCGA
jgi:hypothetical protein